MSELFNALSVSVCCVMLFASGSLSYHREYCVLVLCYFDICNCIVTLNLAEKFHVDIRQVPLPNSGDIKRLLA